MNLTEVAKVKFAFVLTILFASAAAFGAPNTGILHVAGTAR